MEEKPIFSIDKRENPNYPVYFEKRTNTKRSKKPFLVLGVLLLIALTGVTVALASRIWDPLWNPFRPAPEVVLFKVLQAQKDVKTYHIEAYGYLDVKSKEGNFSLELQLKGDADNRDEKTPKSTTNFSYSAYFGPIKIPISGEVITIGDVDYLKIDQFPLSGMILQHLAFMTSKTVLTPEEEMEIEMLKQVATQISDKIVKRWIRISPEELGIEFGKMPRKKAERLEQKLYELITTHPFLQPKKELQDELINGRKAYHYFLIIDRENFKSFLVEFLKFAKEEGIYSWMEEIFSQDKEEELLKNIDEFFQKAGEIGTEIWIDKENYLIYRIKGEKFFKDERKELRISWDFNFSKYNQLVEIVAPEESISITEFLVDILGPFMQVSETTQ
jgi:hypothetical protein